MKRLCVMLIMLLLLGGVAACSPAGSSKAPAESGTETVAAETEISAEETEISAPETEENTPEAEETDSESEILPDFSVKTIDGSEFTLSKALQDHELVLINLFATWCGPCESEFPYLQEAWSQCADKVAVIALSIESDDTEEVLKDFAEELDLTLPMGREEGTDLERFVTIGIPTTLLVDKTGRVVTVEIGAKSSAQEFLDLFDAFSGKN